MRLRHIVIAVAFLACAAPPARRMGVAFATPAPEEPKLVIARAGAAIIVTLDGTMWQDVFSEDANLPTLRRWMATDGVVIGAPGHGEIWSSGPNFISLPGYTEIFTGRASACQTNDCAPTTETTIFDEATERGWDGAVVSSWERIDRVAARFPERMLMDAGRHGATDINAWPGVDDYRPDAFTTRVALRLVEAHLSKLTFIGLGDTDEHAHHGDKARYLEALHAADTFLGELETRVGDRTAIFVTADHGRNAAFRDHGGGWHESGRVWLVAKGGGIARRGAIDTGMHHLSDIAPTIRCLLGMPNDGKPIAEICSND
jgi:uncharacterized protein (DUF1501 family)